MGRAFEVRKESMAKTHQAKAKLYSRYGKEIYMKARDNPNPDVNLDLKRIIEQARKLEVPNSVIERNIEKAKGGTGENFEYARYEGFGPNGSMFIVECLTDNFNRTISEVRNCFTKSNSKLGVSGSVNHLFDELSVFAIKGVNEEEILELLIEENINVNDIEENELGVSIYGDSKDYYNIKKALLNYNENLEFEVDDIMWIPKVEVELTSEEDKEMFEKLITMLDDCLDVQKVYHNVKGE